MVTLYCIYKCELNTLFLMENTKKLCLVSVRISLLLPSGSSVYGSSSAAVLAPSPPSVKILTRSQKSIEE